MKKNWKGIVTTLKDNIIQVSGLTTVKSGEIIKDSYNNKGMVLNIERTLVGVVMFSSLNLKAGSTVYRTYNLAEIQTNFYLFGNVISVLGDVLNNNSYKTRLKTYLLKAKCHN